jgi:hypothetical protein
MKIVMLAALEVQNKYILNPDEEGSEKQMENESRFGRREEKMADGTIVRTAHKVLRMVRKGRNNNTAINRMVMHRFYHHRRKQDEQQTPGYRSTTIFVLFPQFVLLFQLQI